MWLREAPEEARKEAPEDSAGRQRSRSRCTVAAAVSGLKCSRVSASSVTALARVALARVALAPPADVFVHEGKLHMERFRRLKEGQAVESTFKKSTWVGPGICPSHGPWWGVLYWEGEAAERKEPAEAQIKGRQVLQLWRSCQRMQAATPA